MLNKLSARHKDGATKTKRFNNYMSTMILVVKLETRMFFFVSISDKLNERIEIWAIISKYYLIGVKIEGYLKEVWIYFRGSFSSFP